MYMYMYMYMYVFVWDLSYGTYMRCIWDRYGIYIYICMYYMCVWYIYMVCVCLRECIYIYIYIYMYICMIFKYIYIYIYISMCVYKYGICMGYTCIWCVCVCVCVCACVCMYIYIYIYIYIALGSPLVISKGILPGRRCPKRRWTNSRERIPGARTSDKGPTGSEDDLNSRNQEQETKTHPGLTPGKELQASGKSQEERQFK